MSSWSQVAAPILGDVDISDDLDVFFDGTPVASDTSDAALSSGFKTEVVGSGSSSGVSASASTTSWRKVATAVPAVIATDEHDDVDLTSLTLDFDTSYKQRRGRKNELGAWSCDRFGNKTAQTCTTCKTRHVLEVAVGPWCCIFQFGLHIKRGSLRNARTPVVLHAVGFDRSEFACHS